jgi:hypothetical protein
MGGQRKKKAAIMTVLNEKRRAREEEIGNCAFPKGKRALTGRIMMPMNSKKDRALKLSIYENADQRVY